MTIWTKEKCDFLKDNWGKATARELAEQMGPGFTRNSIIGKASRLGLSAKIKIFFIRMSYRIFTVVIC